MSKSAAKTLAFDIDLARGQIDEGLARYTEFNKDCPAQLREAIRSYGSVYAVARDSGVSQSALQRFVTEERDIYLETADRLADFFDLELKPRTQRRKGR